MRSGRCQPPRGVVLRSGTAGVIESSLGFQKFIGSPAGSDIAKGALSQVELSSDVRIRDLRRDSPRVFLILADDKEAHPRARQLVLEQSKEIVFHCAPANDEHLCDER